MTSCPPARPADTGRTESSCPAPLARGCEEHFVEYVANAVRLRLGDFLFLDQAGVGADVEPEMPREESGHPLDVKRTVGLVCACMRRALHDPDLAGPAIRVIESPAVVH